MPLYGNRLTLRRQAGQIGNSTYPPGLAGRYSVIGPEGPLLNRDEFVNNFTVSSRLFTRSQFDVQRPLLMSQPLEGQWLSAALGRLVETAQAPPPPAPLKLMYQVNLPDTLYRKFMQESDNFLAEQLLLLAAAQRYGKPKPEDIIHYAIDTLFTELKLEPRQWVDGSGLSRYNQFTPRQISGLVLRMYQELGPERLQAILPAGGQSGTLQRRFANRPEPYVWAKTGTLRHVIGLSGLVRSANGKWYVFSFLHNNFPGQTSAHYREMEKVLGWVYDNL